VTAKQVAVKKYVVKLSDEERERDCPEIGGHAAIGNCGSGLATGSNR
jgi:hypothetical protein